MKKTLLLFAALALTAGAASAQTSPAARPMGMGQMDRQQMTPEQRADRQAQHLTKQLGLSADQTAKVRELALAQGQEMQAMRANASASTDRRANLEQLKAGKDKYETQLKTILTPDQYTKYEQMRDERMDNRKEKIKDNRMKSRS